MRNAIQTGLADFPDAHTQRAAIRSVSRREELYSGAFVENSPDLLVNFHRGFRVSWQSAVGGFAHSVLEDNMRRWSGDHIVDPESVPGILFMNRAALAQSRANHRSGAHDLELSRSGSARNPWKARRYCDQSDSDDMKICVLGLDCAAPEIVFGDERLVNLRRLMDLGVYGRLESVVPPITVPAWMCMSTSQDPGSLGVYGFRNRSDHSYDKLAFANSASIKALAIWDQLAREGKKSIIVGVPPNYPPRQGERHQHRLFSHAGHGQE